MTTDKIKLQKSLTALADCLKEQMEIHTQIKEHQKLLADFQHNHAVLSQLKKNILLDIERESGPCVYDSLHDTWIMKSDYDVG